MCDDVGMVKTAGMKLGSFFVTLTKRLPSPHFKVLESEMYTMSWGGATVFIQQKVTPPAPHGGGTSDSISSNGDGGLR